VHQKKATLIAIILIVVLGFAIYGNALGGKFVWDDENLVKGNAYIKNLSHLPDIFTKDIAAGVGQKYYFYRPLQMVTYMGDHFLWGLDVRGYHFTNILFHILVAFGLYWFISILYSDRMLSLFTSLLFLVHPLHTEAVTYISGRADSLAALFILLTFIFYIKYLHSSSITSYVLMLITYTLAFLSRENSIILPVFLLLYHYSFRKKIQPKGLVSILGVALIYVLLRLTLLRSLLIHTAVTTTLLERIPGFFVAISSYIRLMVLPFNLHMEYGNKLFSFGNPLAILGLLILILSLACIFVQKKTRGVTFFGLCWFFIMLLPISNIYPVNAYMAEHWLYLPSVGLFLVLAGGLNRLYKSEKTKQLTLIILVILLAFYSLLTARQNIYWRDPIVFYEKTLKYAPDSARMNNNLGNVYNDVNKKKEAIAAYKKAIELDPKYADAYYNLANIYYAINRRGEAIPLYKKAIKFDPIHASAYNNMGTAYNSVGKKEEAIAAYKKAIALEPGDPNAYYNLAMIYFRIEKYELAVKYCNKAERLGFTPSAKFLRSLAPYRKR